MPIPGNLLTTAMAVMPHTDAEEALKTALSLDIPFWPQLPKLSYREDMYVQASEHFPGIIVDMKQRTLSFSMEKFTKDLELFFDHIERPRGVHLCGNPDWSFLLNLDIDILSMDIYTNGEVFTSYAPAISKFLERGCVLCWGIVPTNLEPFEREDTDSLFAMLTGFWEILAKKGVDLDRLLARSLLSPATCCLVNPDGGRTVERAFKAIKELSLRLRENYGLRGSE